MRDGTYRNEGGVILKQGRGIRNDGGYIIMWEGILYVGGNII